MTAPPVLHWSSASITHTGMVRKLNEDACLELVARGIWAVADGMGGHAAGDYASQSIVETLARLPEPASLGEAVSAVRDSLQRVNARLTEEARKRREQVIGSTVVVLLAFGSHAVVVWAGDSRLYRYRPDGLQQLTRDHSQVEELVAQGLITRQQAQRYPGSNVITRAVGVMDPLELDSEMFDVQEGDIFLLCSDGLYNEVSDNEIREALAVGDCQYSCKLLVERALAHGARDNVTVVVARALDEGQITRTQLNRSIQDEPRGGGDDGDPTLLK
jgi:serine/threonine protein phosphatase PrpC